MSASERGDVEAVISLITAGFVVNTRDSVRHTEPQTFTILPLNGVPTAERNNGNSKHCLTIRPLTIPISMHMCHARSFLATPVRYSEVTKHFLTLHKPWQRPTAPKAVKKSH